MARNRKFVVEALNGYLHESTWVASPDGIGQTTEVPQLSDRWRYLVPNRSNGPMTRKKQDVPLPGNDGRWFLELAGIVEPPPSPTSTYTQLKDLEAPPPLVASETAAVTAGAAAVSGSLAGDGEDGDFVPVAPRTTGPLDDWQPDDVSPSLARRGWGRWVVAFLIIALLAAGGVAAFLLPRSVQNQADLLASDYRMSLTDLRNELPQAQDALGILTDPSSDADAVSASVPAIGDLTTRAAIVVGQATTPLPSTLPLVPRTAFEALQPTRTAMLILGAEAEGIAGRLATTFTYRSTVPALFDTPKLPTDADSATVDALSVALAESLADTARLVADLPPDPTFGATRDLAASASERYATWQLEYLDALREGDTERAASLLAELSGAKEAIARELDLALATVRAEVDPRIVTLATETETAITAIP